MIQVIATIELRPGCRDNFLPLLNENVPRVKAEDGCLAYDPFVDVDSGLPELTENTYRVQARDKSAGLNATGFSSPASATTLEVDDTPPVVRQHDEHVQDVKEHRRHREEIHGHERVHVIVQK